ncbi:MAG: hypothetical protein ACT4QA_04170 [Panacagrimonas sp.]
MMTLRVAVIALSLCVSSGVYAQTLAPPARAPVPVAGTAPANDEKPAVQVDLRDNSGTTIVGERESPIGLYITPWRNAHAERDIDRPARLLQVDMSPVDRDVFARQVEYHRALTEASRAKLAPAPAIPAAP